MLAFILYGSLWPFDFRVPESGPGPVEAFLRTWNARPGRGDFLANILLYVPFGGFFALGFRRWPGFVVFLLTVFVGGCLSLSMELTQDHDIGRDTEATDFYANTLGTLVGALGAVVAGPMSMAPLDGTVALRPMMLIGAWLAYRLYPYVPTIDLHKYWRAVRPIFFGPEVTVYDLFRQTAIWLTLCTLIDAAVRGRRSFRLMLLFGAMVFCAKVVIIDTTVRLAELDGYGIALAAWLLSRRLPPRARAGPPARPRAAPRNWPGSPGSSRAYPANRRSFSRRRRRTLPCRTLTVFVPWATTHRLAWATTCSFSVFRWDRRNRSGTPGIFVLIRAVVGRVR